MQDISNNGQTAFDEVKKISAELQSLENKNQLCQLFIHMIKFEDKVTTLHHLLAEAGTDNSLTAYTIEQGSQVQEILDDPASIGKLTVQATTRLKLSRSTTAPVLKMTPGQPPTIPSTATAVPIAKNPKYMTTVLVRDIKAETKSETHECRVTGSALLPGYKFILADYNNNKVKLLNLQTLEVTSELKLSSWPWDITSFTADQVAVTLPSRRKIVFVKVSDALEKDREMHVAGVCKAILHNNGKLIVSFTDPMKIVIMTLNGTVERKIERGWFALRSLFKWPSHMTLSLDCKSIYVSDINGDCVKRITLDGTIEAEYRDKELALPTGITVDQHGRVLVCGESSCNIHLLTPDLTKVKVLVDKLDYPQSLCYCHRTGRLFVGMESDNVKVYQLS